jgi:hypothetical protein
MRTPVRVPNTAPVGNDTAMPPEVIEAAIATLRVVLAIGGHVDLPVDIGNFNATEATVGVDSGQTEDDCQDGKGEKCILWCYFK